MGFRQFASLFVVAAVSTFGSPPVSLAAADAGEKFFETNVRPLLTKHCYRCHGPRQQKSELRLDSRAAMLKGGELGPALVPGKPAASALLSAVRYEELEMPPDKKLADREIQLLEQWVKMGAPWPKSAPVKQGEKITDEDRRFWSFQPLPARVELPAGDASHPIDRFVRSRLKGTGLTASPRASLRTIVRRAYLDLHGLPPTAAQLDEFTSGPNSIAVAANYERLLKKLLASSRYGERWARHWLDLVRFAESDGFKQDGFRSQAWRYRDYVIEALNADKPYDQFVREQLAGDQLDPHDPQMSVATMFLRHGIYEYNQRDVRSQRQNMLNEVTDVTADVFLGMGLGCARCHDHKFDPILQRDYFRFQAFFEPMVGRDDLPLASPQEIEAYQAKLRVWEEKTAAIRAEIDKLEFSFIRNARHAAIEKFPKDIRPMLRKQPSARSPLEQQLAELAGRQVVTAIDQNGIDKKIKGDKRKRWLELREKLRTFDHLRPKQLPPAFTVRDVGPQAPPTRIPGETDVIEPGYLTVLAPGPAKIAPQRTSTGRRLALANWIASPTNPLTARVIVNRVWQFHFGKGLVATSSDFGNLGEPPSHPALLDYLARRFVDNGWSLKKLHLFIMSSETYQQASLGTKEGLRIDPANRLLWRMNSRRLDAEQIRDAMLAASGEIDLRAGGPSSDQSSPRRTVYTKVMRNKRDPLIAVFDGADPFISTSRRINTTTPNQALLMLNGPWALDRASALARRVHTRHKDLTSAISAVYRQVLGREPTSDEVVDARQFVESQAAGAPSRRPKLDKLAERKGVALGKSNDLLRLDNTKALPDADFTIEAFVQLRSMYESAEVRTIVSQWNSNTKQPGWSLGVTSKKSRYKPLNLILQLTGDPAKGGKPYEVVASDLRLELNKPYYVAASVRIADTTRNGITFYAKSLVGDQPLQTARVAHRVDSSYRGTFPLVLGGRAGSTGHRWDGVVGEVRLTASSLAEQQLLINRGQRNPQGIVGWWKFANADSVFEDSSPRGNNLVMQGSGGSPRVVGLTDLCHVLLNSSEFVFID